MNLSIVDLNNLNEFVEVTTRKDREYYEGPFGGYSTYFTHETTEQEYYINDALAVELIGDDDITEMHEAYFDEVKYAIEGFCPKLYDDYGDEFDIDVIMLRHEDHKTYFNVGVV